MAKIASLFRLGNFDLNGSTSCIVLMLMSIMLFPAYAHSEVIISNERDGRAVRVFSATEILPRKYLDTSEDEKESTSRSNNPANKPEIVLK